MRTQFARRIALGCMVTIVAGACAASAPTASPSRTPLPSPSVVPSPSAVVPASALIPSPAVVPSPTVDPSPAVVASPSLVAPSSVAPSPSTAASPSPPESPSPSTGAGFGPVESAEQAIAAVGAFDSQFLGYRQQVPGQIGDGPHVVVSKVADGWQLTFVTGSGDCFAGCINHVYAKFLVTPSGQVTALCTWTTEADRVIDGERC
jgi:hypothetical protein